jgi:hypothetical protein
LFQLLRLLPLLHPRLPRLHLHLHLHLRLQILMLLSPKMLGHLSC